ncbi:uncharacterized protein Eint_070650 [Encephalitozoon intestinalis ATCC 50506]|uniref:Uncharacterized protein n=1 Tax=Encephalitozoon intestinalis (strain ATCC 50506) TaxID=876142 RepID=E0S7Z4_ENCIT|nr:uncharacterized protein Eint_070650 [Encephalitozoon intestinalis ATCC 50506]ADM11829.1 hypothetical protein Eint_070650 [Encephalitozoon intestinalis ATCC 50506]UTX45579.1 hypothetical protein GPK93_07g11430 [Encephalitozoon intestinalis]
MRLKALIKKRTNDLLVALRSLRGKICSEDVLRQVLGNIHKSYIRLEVLLNKPGLSHQEPVEVDSTNGVVRYKTGNLEFLYHEEHGVISVSTGDTGINNYLLCLIRGKPVDTHLETASAMLGMYAGNERALCDVCGNYATVPGLLTPICRSPEEDFVLVHHAQCKVESLEK